MQRLGEMLSALYIIALVPLPWSPRGGKGQIIQNIPEMQSLPIYIDILW